MEISEIADLAEEEEVSTPALYGQVHAFKRLMRQAGFVDSKKNKRSGAMIHESHQKGFHKVKRCQKSDQES